jgi:hypothetical protein
MVEQFEVRWEGILPAPPAAVWQGITERADGHLWPVSYEPFVGGAETGLTAGGGTVTAWEPPRRFATRTRPGTERDGLNEVVYELEPVAGVTVLRYRHRAEVPASELDLQLAACRAHTAFYLHSLGQYACLFAGRVPAYVRVDGPPASAEGGFVALRRALGLPDDVVAGDPVTLRPSGLPGIDGVVDYATGPFLGIRTADALIRVYGRDAWGWPVGVALHLFAPGADAAAAQAAWSAFVDGACAAEVVA